MTNGQLKPEFKTANARSSRNRHPKSTLQKPTLTVVGKQVEVLEKPAIPTPEVKAEEQQENRPISNTPRRRPGYKPVVENEKHEWDLITEKFNRNHAQVILGGKHHIVRFIQDRYNPERYTYEFILQKELKMLYQHTSVRISGDKYVDYVTAWAKHPDSRRYRQGVVFKPYPPTAEAPKLNGYFNLWQGFGVSPLAIYESSPELQEKLEIVYKHIEQVICNGDAALIEYFYNWVAYTVQNPDKPAGAALVLRGDKGTGKGVIGHFLRKMWGNHGLHISNSQHFVGKFNAHLADGCFLFADEAFYSGDKQHESVLKALITEDKMLIERKGIDAEQHPNCLKVFMATNSDWAVPASRDERRYCVFDVTAKKKGNTDYFTALSNACNTKEVQALFLDEMLKREIQNFHTGNIPETQGLMEQRLESLNSLGKWLFESLHDGYFKRDVEHYSSTSLSWENQLSSQCLMSSYQLWCTKNKQSYPASVTAMGLYFSKLGFEKKKDKKGNYYRVFGSLSDAIAKFEAYEKVKIS